jgi:hypothetical protein
VAPPDDFVPIPPAPRDSAEPNWQFIMWGAMALAVVATAALLAIAANSIFVSDDANPATTSSTSTTVTTIPVSAEPVELVGHPVTEAITIVGPRFGAQVQYIRDGVVATFTIGGGECGRGDGTIGVAGWIRNDSRTGQALDYVIGVDLMRAFTGSRIAHVEAEVLELAPGTIAEWDAEAVSSQVVTLRCDLTDITVLPAGSR